MDIIHLLPDIVANQIAAGEVVQRPASVIKELVENAIDAHATQIQVILREAGRDLIQVIDNGQGMSPMDARMAFEKHATSKISQATDLFDLHTMGFRGEALASIAAVAEVELRTRRKDDETGVLIALSGSILQRQETVACPVGANFQVRNLFYNIPARRKFLKSHSTELSNIMAEIQRVALANPQVEISVISDDRPTLSLTSGSLKQRILQLFSKSMDKQLIPLQMDNELLSVTGFVSVPEAARKKGAQQFFFVNDRYMRHPFFHKAVMEAFQNLLPEGAQPNYFIFLRVDPKSIDVNISPTKTEIKFENEPARWHILMATIREALGKYTALPSIDFDQADMPEMPATYLQVDDSGQVRQPAEPRPVFDHNFNPFRRDSNLSQWSSLYEGFEQDKSVPYQSMGSRISSQAPRQVEEMTFETAPSAMSMLSTEKQDEAMAQLLPEGADQSLVTDAAKHRLIQVSGRYIAMQGRQGLVLVDQHRAHVCVLFDSYFTQISHRKCASQGEFFPYVIQVSPADEPILEQIMPQLKYLGFGLDNLGGGSYSVNSTPAALSRNTDIRVLLQQMIDAAREEVHGLTEDLDRTLALRLSQAQAIPSGKVMSDEEMTQLIDSLFALPDYTRTPDGKLVVAKLPVETLTSLF